MNMKRSKLFWTVLILILIVLSVIVISSAEPEALVLESNTLITPFDPITQTFLEMYTLSEARFLLDSKDMENAAIAFETVTIREEQIKALEGLIDEMKKDTTIRLIALGSGGLLLGLIIGLLIP
jgi:hypothetical protein